MFVHFVLIRTLASCVCLHCLFRLFALPLETVSVHSSPRGLPPRHLATSPPPSPVLSRTPYCLYYSRCPKVQEHLDMFRIDWDSNIIPLTNLLQCFLWFYEGWRRFSPFHTNIRNIIKSKTFLKNHVFQKSKRKLISFRPTLCLKNSPNTIINCRSFDSYLFSFYSDDVAWSQIKTCLRLNLQTLLCTLTPYPPTNPPHIHYSAQPLITSTVVTSHLSSFMYSYIFPYCF